MGALERGVVIRIRVIGGIFLLAFSLIVVRAFDLQVLQGQDWNGRAERQHQKTLSLTPQRGTIFDRNGTELAVSVEVDSIYAEPARIEDRRATARQLAKTLQLPIKTVSGKLASDKSFVWIKRQVTPKQSAQLKTFELAGVGRISEHRRFYPNSNLAAHLLGFTGLDPKGLEGLEREYDHRVLGRGGYLVLGRDALGRGMGSGSSEVQGGQKGDDLYLTLDKNLQHIVERELADGVASARARAGTVVMLEPATGKVLAMASYPEFNPNDLAGHRPQQWRNRAICDTYEPGSTFKVILMAAALSEGVVNTRQKLYCEDGTFRVGGRTVHDHDKYQELTPAEIIKYSSNIGAAKIGKLLERQKYYRYIKAFGFGEKSGIDLPGEVHGLLNSPDKWFEIDLAAISFGQGVSVTPLQLTSAVSAIANNGYLMEPYVVERMVDSEGGVVAEIQPRAVRKVISSEVAEQVTAMMVATTEEGGTATNARVPGFQVAGKTGTAQKVDPVTGGYSADKRVASFVGFLPAHAPRVTILVVIDEPQNGVYGGLLAAPVFARIASQTMQYLKVSPDQPSGGDHGAPFDPLPEGEGEYQAKLVRTPQTSMEDGPAMPDFQGLSYRQVLEVIGEKQLNVNFRGQGRVVEQSHGPGVAIPFGSPVWVRLAPPS
ncbi:MAG: penicillin-binding protein [Desulfuromonas sp.]|nr:MAG: penicillin-binding protein [Desulfuromonas sp.]